MPRPVVTKPKNRPWLRPTQESSPILSGLISSCAFRRMHFIHNSVDCSPMPSIGISFPQNLLPGALPRISILDLDSAYKQTKAYPNVPCNRGGGELSFGITKWTDPPNWYGGTMTLPRHRRRERVLRHSLMGRVKAGQRSVVHRCMATPSSYIHSMRYASCFSVTDDDMSARYLLQADERSGIELKQISSTSR